MSGQLTPLQTRVDLLLLFLTSRLFTRLATAEPNSALEPLVRRGLSQSDRVISSRRGLDHIACVVTRNVNGEFQQHAP